MLFAASRGAAIVVVFTIVVAANWGAPQWTASVLGYQQALGAPWFTVASYPVYLPWRLFEWWYAFEPYAPHVFERAGAMAAGGGVLGALFAVLNSVWRARQNQLITTYGSARWATPKEITAAGLFEPKGVFLGRVGDDYPIATYCCAARPTQGAKTRHRAHFQRHRNWNNFSVAREQSMKVLQRRFLYLTAVAVALRAM
jgi:type IV secretory pathway TraG/TraD family ATPase VirD4